MTPQDALAAIEALAEPGRAAGMADYHKAPRRYIGVPNTALNALTTDWRRSLSIAERVTLADALWQMDIFETRLAAAKLLTQARITPDADAWALITGWRHDFDSWAIADHAMMAGQKRLVADPSRIEEVETWTSGDTHWIRRAAMVITLPFAKQNHPKPHESDIRERVLGWAARYVQDPEWFIQKSVAWWLRDLSKHDPERVRAFLGENAKHMKPFARKEAQKHMPPPETSEA